MNQKYARLESGIVKETITPPGGVKIEDMFHPDLVWVPCSDEVEQGWTCEGTNFSAPIPPAPTWKQVQEQAKGFLDASDMIAIRCFKAGVSFPTEWHTYVEELRAIIRAESGDPTQALPTRPAYPSGT